MPKLNEDQFGPSTTDEVQVGHVIRTVPASGGKNRVTMKVTHKEPLKTGHLVTGKVTVAKGTRYERERNKTIIMDHGQPVERRL